MTAFHQPLHLLLIDAQNDFCDLPAPAHPALPVKGADADMRRVAALVRDAGDALDAITLTLDSHHRYDIAHPGFWWAAEPGTEVAPFTEITAAQVRAGQFQPRDPAALPRTLAYLDSLGSPGALHADGLAGPLRGRHLGPPAPRRRARRLRRLGNSAASAPATSSTRA